MMTLIHYAPVSETTVLVYTRLLDILTLIWAYTRKNFLIKKIHFPPKCCLGQLNTRPTGVKNCPGLGPSSPIGSADYDLTYTIGTSNCSTVACDNSYIVYMNIYIYIYTYTHIFINIHIHMGCRNSGCRNKGCRNNGCRNCGMYPHLHCCLACLTQPLQHTMHTHITSSTPQAAILHA
jgi:hypothetical protein